MILALIEHDRGALEEASLQAVTFARRAAEGLGVPLAAAVIGAGSDALADDMRQHGAAAVIRVEHDRLDDYAPLAWARCLVQLVHAKQPAMVVAASTDRGNEVLAHVAALLDLPMAANCAEVHPGEPFGVTRMRWGSSLLEEARLTGDPKLITVALHVVAPEPAETPGEGAVEAFTPELEEGDFLVRVVAREVEAEEGISLKTAPVVVGGGRGVGSPEGYAVLEELAGLLGGAVGGSRVATNNGWRPHADQIGLTGNRIAPELYIACGISGAIQHLVGCKGAKRILVINKDPEAAFFAKADYGVVGDLHEVVPAIIEEIRKGS